MNDEQSAKILKQLRNLAGQLLQVRIMLFAVFVGLVYSYTVLKINHYSGVNPSSTDISQAVLTSQQKSPKIDQSVVDKIEQLKDNSVEVQALFNEARSNPFQE